MGEHIAEQAELEMPMVGWRYSKSLLKQRCLEMVGNRRELKKAYRKQKKKLN